MDLIPNKLNRRDFSQLTVAAMGGIIAGTAAGCGSSETAEKKTAESGSEAAGGDEGGLPEDWKEIITSGKNVCRGLNQCKGHKDGENTCAGTGVCATAKAHTCHTANECKGEGGCGSSVGRNACSGKGECAVPLGAKAWKDARAAFEEAMKSAGKEFGEAPAKS